MSDDIHQDDKVAQDNLAELTALMRKQVQLTEEKVKAANAPAADQQLHDLRVKITRVAALIIVSAGLAELLVHRTTSQPPRPIQSFGAAFFTLSVFGGLFIVLVDSISSLLRRAIWGQVNAATAAPPAEPTPPIAPAGEVSRAKFWAGVVVVVVIASGFVVFAVQSQRLAAQQQQRRDCLQLSSLRTQERLAPPLPPPPPPLIPGQKVSPELEASITRMEELRQKLTERRRKWETNELPIIRERRAALEKKLAGTQCDAPQ